MILIQGFLTELAQLLIGLDKGKEKGPLFKHFFLIFDFINEPFEIPEQLTVEQKLLKVKGYIHVKVFKNC